jgi:hypothetical protein
MMMQAIVFSRTLYSRKVSATYAAAVDGFRVSLMRGIGISSRMILNFGVTLPGSIRQYCGIEFLQRNQDESVA